MVAQTTCRLCGGEASRAFKVADRNRGIPGGPFPYVRCHDCGVISIAEIPSDLGSYYPADYFAYPTLEQLGQMARDERYRLEFLTRNARPGQLVEVGPGVGILLYDAKQVGYEGVAIDRDPQACEYLRQTLGVEARVSDEPQRELVNLPPSRAIAMWHVIEHLADPWAVLEAAASNLEDGGVIVIAAPNPDSLGMRLLGRRWPHIDAPRHLQLIPLMELRRRAAALGLIEREVTTTDPGALHWNEFSWNWALGAPRPGKWGTIRYQAAKAAAKLITFVLRPWERRGLNGAAYTVVFSKRPSSS